MKWAVIIAGAFLIFAIARTAMLIGAFVSQPQVSVMEPSFDFGRIPASQPARHRFVLTNIGSAELLILGLKKSCECIIGKLPRRAIAPGESVPLDLTFTPKKTGHRQGRIVVNTNDPRNPVIVLTLMATATEATTAPALPEAGQ